jgi:hypothetical protein
MIARFTLVQMYTRMLNQVDRKIEDMKNRRAEFNAERWRALHQERARLSDRLIDLTS